jgi:hypothetical protein
VCFPSAIGKHKITSNQDLTYNCIGFAANDTTRWWSHESGYYWPAPNRSPLVSSLVQVFVGLNFDNLGPRGNRDLETGVLKVVLYEKNGQWTHAARQLPNGKWTSKLGRDEDIEHDTPECLCGATYGTVHCIMRKALK